MKREVVITGLGAMTALGEGFKPLWEAALQSRSGIDYIGFDGDTPHATTVTGAAPEWKLIGASIQDFIPEKYVSQRKSLKVMARDIQLAVAAAKLALDDAAIDFSKTDKERAGIIAGAGVLNHEIDELAMSVLNSVDEEGKLDLEKFGREGLPSLFPLWLLKYLPNMPACHISILFDLQGPSNTVTTGSSSGLQAVGEAFRIIERGTADVMLAGGAESKINPVGISQYQILSVMPQPNGHAPKEVYRPFDRTSEGFVAGEGAGFIVLEERSHAEKRGAKIYATIKGFASSSSDGIEYAMRSALREAAIDASAVDYVQACGLGLAEDDAREAEAIEKIQKTSNTVWPVSASKPVMGFTGFASGALDLILSTLSLKHQTIPPVMNFDSPSREWAFRLVKSDPLKKTIRNVLTNSFGFGGQSASILTSVYEGKKS